MYTKCSLDTWGCKYMYMPYMYMCMCTYTVHVHVHYMHVYAHVPIPHEKLKCVHACTVYITGTLYTCMRYHLKCIHMYMHMYLVHVHVHSKWHLHGTCTCTCNYGKTPWIKKIHLFTGKFRLLCTVRRQHIPWWLFPSPWCSTEIRLAYERNETKNIVMEL